AYSPHFWGGPLLGFKAPNPRTLEIAERSFTQMVRSGLDVSRCSMSAWPWRRAMCCTCDRRRQRSISSMRVAECAW
ncbi:hypothetical protein, partial [Microbacterium sp. P5_E9]